MSTKPAARIGWKKELAALAFGLLLGSAWEGAQAGLRLDWPGIVATAHRP